MDHELKPHHEIHNTVKNWPNF